MAHTIYSTHYVNDRGKIIWTESTGLVGLFQIKEDSEAFIAHAQDSPSYKYPKEYTDMRLVDYDTARHWPHP